MEQKLRKGTLRPVTFSADPYAVPQVSRGEPGEADWFFQDEQPALIILTGESWVRADEHATGIGLFAEQENLLGVIEMWPRGFTGTHRVGPCALFPLKLGWLTPEAHASLTGSRRLATAGGARAG